MCFKGLKTIRGLGLRLDLLLVNFLAFAHTGLCEESAHVYSLLSTEFCPSEWNFYDDGFTCFRQYYTPKEWQSAEDSCRAVGSGHLAIVPDFDALLYITAHYANAWIGARYDQNGWTWVNGEDMTFKSELRASPLDFSSPKHCVTLQRSVFYKRKCTKLYNFLCQTEPSPVYHLTSSTSKAQRLACPTGWMFYKEEETCFKVMGDPELSWDAARQSCRSMAGDLAVLLHNNTFEFILGGDPSSDEFWAGLTFSYVANTYTWINGETSRALDSLPKESRCITTSRYSASPADCQTPHQYICQKDVSSIIPKVSTHCFKGWHYHPQTKTCFWTELKMGSWDRARRRCKMYGADLARITDMDTDNFIKNNIINVGNWKNTYYWIGLKKGSSGHDEYYWLDDKQENTFEHNIFEEPRNRMTSECVVLSSFGVISHTDDWVLTRCNNRKRSICQMEALVTTSYGLTNEKLTTGTRKSISKFTLTCPGNWTFFEKGGICLGFFEDPPVSYANAERICNESGAHLAKISDRNVNGFVTAHRRLDLNYWIGLHSPDYNNDNLVWPDGTSVTFLNWAEGESTKSGCVGIHPPSDLWKVTDCADTHAVICQINHVSVPGELEEWTLNGKSIYVSTKKTQRSSVQSECESFGKTELFLESDDEFLQLVAWLNTNSHAFDEDIWIKASKLNYNDSRWANESIKVGELGIWAGNSTGYPCYNLYGLHDCCTFISNNHTSEDPTFQLQEKACEQEALFLCDGTIEPSTPSTASTLGSASSSNSQSNSESLTLPSAVSFNSVSTSLTSRTTHPAIIPTTVLPPLPPSQPLTSVEKQEVKESLNALKSISTSTTTSNSNGNDSTVVVVNKMCPCPCTAIKFSGMPSPGALAKMVNKIQDFLRVETTSLISAKSKKSSAKDDRPSSQSIAVVAVIFGSVPFVTVIAFDLVRVYQYIVAQRALKK